MAHLGRLSQSNNVGARIGEGIGQGLADQVPKEIDRYRLSEGLKAFEQESEGLTPMQQLTRLSSIPGITPQMIQSFGDLAKQQAKGKALNANRSPEQRPSPFAERQSPKPGGQGESPSITTRNPIDATLNPHIPKTYDQILDRAGQMYNANPGLYNSDPNLAIQAATQEDAQNQSINSALQGQRANEQNVQNRVQADLKAQQKELGANVPGNVFSEIEDKAINAVKSVSQGGEGLTEQQAIKKYGKELDGVSRDYQALDTLGGWTLLTKSPKGNKDAIRSNREKFKERNDLENFADSLTSKNGLSPSKSYYLAYPVSENKELNNAIVKLPKMKIDYASRRHGFIQNDQERIAAETYKVAEKLSSLMGKQASPLAIAEELNSRGYDPQAWMNYVDKNRKKLDLSERQARELDKSRDFTPSLDDLWMFIFSGLDPLLEQ